MQTLLIFSYASAKLEKKYRSCTVPTESLIMDCGSFGGAIRAMPLKKLLEISQFIFPSVNHQEAFLSLHGSMIQEQIAQ